LAKAVAFDRAGKNYGGSALVVRRGLICGVDLARVVAPLAQRAKLFVGVMFNQGQKPRVGPKNVLANVGARFHSELLHLPVDHFAEPLDEQALGIALKDGIPVRSPNNLDAVPACAAEGRFEFLYDLSVPAHGTIQALKVAVDDKNEIIEPLAGGQCDGAEGFGF